MDPGRLLYFNACTFCVPIQCGMSNAAHLSHLVRACHNLNPVYIEACPLTLLFVMQVTIIDPCREQWEWESQQNTINWTKGGADKIWCSGQSMHCAVDKKYCFMEMDSNTRGDWRPNQLSIWYRSIRLWLWHPAECLVVNSYIAAGPQAG